MDVNELAIEGRRKLVSIARAFLAGEFDAIEASRRICRAHSRLPEREDPLFDRFVGIECESECFPPDQSRRLWQAKYLAELDDERSRYAKAVQADVVEGCQRLFERYQPVLEGVVLQGVTYELFESDQRGLDAVRTDRDHEIDREIRLDLQDGSSVFVSWSLDCPSAGGYTVSMHRDRFFIGTAALIRDVSDSAFWSPFLGESIRLEFVDLEHMCMMLSSERERRFLSTWSMGSFGGDVLFLSHDPPRERPYEPSSIQ